MDIQHFFIEKGQGEPIILLHGNGENSDYFVNQIGVLSKIYHVYALDTRGHGRTPRGDRPFTIRQFADDLFGFMKEQHIRQSNLLGFSDGANIAMVFAIRYPEMVKRLILNGANLNAKGVKATTQIPIEIGYKIAKRCANKKAEMLGLMVNDPNIFASELSAIKAETLVIAGTKDMIKEVHTRQIASHISNCELKFIKGNHFIANKNPDEFNEAILNFLRD
ncbi:MAG: alpha/beta hydrolase [Anaerostipes sp.]|nr:alpha/beta hydrolase [Anaerostipes sp.]